MHPVRSTPAAPRSSVAFFDAALSAQSMLSAPTQTVFEQGGGSTKLQYQAQYFTWITMYIAPAALQLWSTMATSQPNSFANISAFADVLAFLLGVASIAFALACTGHRSAVYRSSCADWASESSQLKTHRAIRHACTHTHTQFCHSEELGNLCFRLCRTRLSLISVQSTESLVPMHPHMSGITVPLVLQLPNRSFGCCKIPTDLFTSVCNYVQTCLCLNSTSK